MNKFKNILFVFLGCLFINSSCEQEISVSPVEEIPKYATIYLNSIPQGADIIINGRKSGYITPSKIDWLEEGQYEFTLSLKYFKDTTVTKILSLGKEDTILIDYLSNPSMYGSIKFQTIPAGATVILNNNPTGKLTPITISSIIPGEYHVQFDLAEHRSEETDVIVTSSTIADAFAELTDTSVWVDYNSKTIGFPTDEMNKIIYFKGTIYIGTKDFGIIAFDGKSFSMINKLSGSIPSNTITDYEIDGLGNLWIGTTSGAVKFDGSGFITFNNQNSGLPNNVIEDIKAKGNDGVYFATQNGLAYFDFTNWEVYNSSTISIDDNWIKAVALDNTGYIWIGTASRGIYKFNKSQIKNFNEQNSNLPSNGISCMEWDGNWLFVGYDESINSPGGIIAFDGTTWNKNLFMFEANFVREIYIDSENNKWAASNTGIHMLSNSNIINNFTTQNSNIKTNSINSIYRVGDRVWIATEKKGVYKFKL